MAAKKDQRKTAKRKTTRKQTQNKYTVEQLQAMFWTAFGAGASMPSDPDVFDQELTKTLYKNVADRVALFISKKNLDRAIACSFEAGIEAHKIAFGNEPKISGKTYVAAVTIVSDKNKAHRLLVSARSTAVKEALANSQMGNIC